MPQKTALLDEAGFTLLEVIVAIAILGLAVAGLAGALATGLRISNVVEEQVVSATMATRHMEETLAGVGATADCDNLTMEEDYSVCIPAGDNDDLTVTVYSGNEVLFEVTTRRAGDR